jgi:hypothetical protein
VYDRFEHTFVARTSVRTANNCAQVVRAALKKSAVRIGAGFASCGGDERAL